MFITLMACKMSPNRASVLVFLPVATRSEVTCSLSICYLCWRTTEAKAPMAWRSLVLWVISLRMEDGETTFSIKKVSASLSLAISALKTIVLQLWMKLDVFAKGMP